MIFNQYHKLLELETEKTEWTIRVRAQAIWEGINRTTMEFRGLNVIFIDDSNCRIHAFVSAKIYDIFKGQLKEGNIYSVSNFHVRYYDGEEQNRAIRNEKHIYFDNYTKLKPEADNITHIAPYSFDLFDFDDVDLFVKDSRFLIDVVGVIVHTNVECVFSKDDKSKSHIRFKITDGRSEIKVTFFNKLGEELEKQLNEMKDQQVVIIIASAKVNLHEGVTCLNNYPATRFYLNAEHYSVKQLNNRLADPLFNLKPMVTEDNNDEKMYTIAEIKKFTEEYIERKVKCQVNVKKVEEISNWYDNVCTSCDQEVNIVQGRFKCEPCKRNIPFPDKRFRLATVCKDTTGILGIIFPDDEIQRITGMNVFEVENDDTQVGEGITFPPLLKSFESKDFIVSLLINANNINKSCNVYIASAIDELPEMLGNHNPSETTTVSTNQNSITMELDPTLKVHSDSPGTEKSSNKVKARKSNESVPIQLDENVPIRKFKNIKKEFVKGNVA